MATVAEIEQQIAELRARLSSLGSAADEVRGEIRGLERERNDLFSRARFLDSQGDTAGAAELRAQATQIEARLGQLYQSPAFNNLTAAQLQIQKLEAELYNAQQKAKFEEQQAKQPPATEERTAAEKAESDRTTPVVDKPAPVPPEGGDNANTAPTAENPSQTKQTVAQDDKPPPSAATTQTAANQVNANTADPSNGFVKPQPNVLDSFASTTWSASVYLLAPYLYKELVTGLESGIPGAYLLFQTAGAGAQAGTIGNRTTQTGTAGVDPVKVGGAGGGVARNAFFTEDFYIDSLTLETVLPGGGTGAAHSATTLKFTVIEPGNISLLDRLYLAVQDANQGSVDNSIVNYSAAQYLLVISWFGYDIAGNLIKNSTITEDAKTKLINPNAALQKLIPFTINNIDFSVGGKLVSYDFDCSPVGQIIAGGTRRSTIPRDIQLTAGTVGQLLRGGGADVTNSAASAPGANTTNTTNTQPAKSPSKANNAPAGKITLKQGLATVMNETAQEPVSKNIYTIADQYEIVFVGPGSDEIENATLILPGSIVNQSTSPMATSASENANTALNPNASAMQTKYKNWSITAGMQIVQVIDLAIRNSSYIYNQSLTVLNAQGKEQVNASVANKISDSKPMKWFKINFVAIPIANDPARNDYAYKLRFEISAYTLRQFDSRYFPLTPFRGVHKSYPYWFTGQNTAVLDYTAKFSNLYNLTVTGGPGQENNVNKARRAATANMRELVKINYFPTSTESNKGAANNANEVGANASEYLYQEDNPGGTDLRIIGDPAWIQQGSLTGRLTNGKDFSILPFLPDGTINFDSSQVMFEVSWQRPEDYDLTTGLADPYARPGNASRQPQQSNVYVATKVMHEFRGGKFEQVVNGALFNYPKPDGLNTVNGGATVGKSTDKAAAAAGTASNAVSSNGAVERDNAAVSGVRSSADGAGPNPISATASGPNGFLDSAQKQLQGAGAMVASSLNTSTIQDFSNSIAPFAAVNNVVPASYPRAPTGSGVGPAPLPNLADAGLPDVLRTAVKKINDNPLATAVYGRTQLISKDA